jgi:MFS transporter, DHA2 family, multidrug resistance protein
MAGRFGRKRLFIGCITGFTIASMLCGAAQSPAQIVGFRLLQGMRRPRAEAAVATEPME